MYFNSSGNVVDLSGVMWYTYGTKYDSSIENFTLGSGKSAPYITGTVPCDIFFIMSKGKIVVDLDKLTYERYSEEDVLPEEYQAIFDNPDSFKWMPEKERFWH